VIEKTVFLQVAFYLNEKDRENPEKTVKKTDTIGYWSNTEKINYNYE